MINSLDKSCSDTDTNQSYEDKEARVIANDVKLTSTRTSELLSSNAGHVSTNTRVTLKRVTHTSGTIGSGKKVTLVHSSTVTTTRRGSGPGVVSPTVNVDGHAVFGFDLLNQIPRSGDLFGWVNNLDTFIKEQNVGLKEEQVRTVSAGATDTNRHQDISAVEEALNNKSEKENDENPAASNGAAGPKFFDVCHCASFSQMGSTK
jgi:hypothetical protein